MAKAASWLDTDAEVRKRGEQTGLDTLVVHAVNDADSSLDDKKKFSQQKKLRMNEIVQFGRTSESYLDGRGFNPPSHY